jgi:hypothetical protein
MKVAELVAQMAKAREVALACRRALKAVRSSGAATIVIDGPIDAALADRIIPQLHAEADAELEVQINSRTGSIQAAARIAGAIMACRVTTVADDCHGPAILILLAGQQRMATAQARISMHTNDPEADKLIGSLYEIRCRPNAEAMTTFRECRKAKLPLDGDEAKAIALVSGQRRPAYAPPQRGRPNGRIVTALTRAMEQAFMSGDAAPVCGMPSQYMHEIMAMLSKKENQ